MKIRIWCGQDAMGRMYNIRGKIQSRPSRTQSDDVNIRECIAVATNAPKVIDRLGWFSGVKRFMDLLPHGLL